MDITRITGNNEACFAHVLNGTAVTATENMLRIGAVDDEGNGVAALSAYFDAQFIAILRASSNESLLIPYPFDTYLKESGHTNVRLALLNG
jgi:hypothetical protein